MTLRLTVLIAVFLLQTGCIDQFNYQQQAQQTCTCMKPVFSFDKLSQMAIMAGDTATLTKLAANLETIEEEGDRCMEQLQGLVNQFNDRQKNKLWIAISDQCPGILSQIRARLDTTFFTKENNQ